MNIVKKKCTETDGWKRAQLKSQQTQRENNLKKEKLYYKSPNLCKQCDCIIEYKKRKNKFCCHSCSATFNNKGIRRHGTRIKNKHCVECSKPLTSQYKYCDNSCKSKHQRSMYIESWKCGNENGDRVNIIYQDILDNTYLKSMITNVVNVDGTLHTL